MIGARQAPCAVRSPSSSGRSCSCSRSPASSPPPSKALEIFPLAIVHGLALMGDRLHDRLDLRRARQPRGHARAARDQEDRRPRRRLLHRRPGARRRRRRAAREDVLPRPRRVRQLRHARHQPRVPAGRQRLARLPRRGDRHVHPRLGRDGHRREPGRAQGRRRRRDRRRAGARRAALRPRHRRLLQPRALVRPGAGLRRRGPTPGCTSSPRSSAALVAAFTYLAIMQLATPSLPTQTARRGESAEPPVAV